MNRAGVDYRYMTRLGTYGYKDMVDMVANLNKCAPVYLPVVIPVVIPFD